MRDRSDWDDDRHSRAGGRIVPDNAEENLHAHAHSNAAKTHEEKNDGGKPPDAEAVCVAGKVVIAKEKTRVESNAQRDIDAKRVAEEEKIIADSFARILSELIEQEKETQIFADTESVARRITISFSESERHT